MSEGDSELENESESESDRGLPAVKIQLNGEVQQIPETWTVSDLLKHLKIESRYCAVERNRIVVPREDHAACVLDEDDRIEIVTLVGGG